MMHLNFCGFDCSYTVTPAPPYGGLHRKAGAQSFVSQPYGGLGPGLRRGDGDGFESVYKNANPSIHEPSRAKMPQTAIQMRAFAS